MTSRRTTRLAAALTFLALGVAGLPGIVQAHAALDTVTPADKSTVGASPAEIVMTFTETLDPGRSSIRLVDATGALIVEGGAIDVDDAKTLRLVVPANLAPGTYTIRWTSFSTQDNEQDRGTTTFTLAPSTAPPTVTPSASPSVAPSASPSVASLAPSVVPSPSAPPTSPTTSTSDALIPIIVVVVAIIGLGVWLARGRSRRGA